MRRHARGLIQGEAKQVDRASNTTPEEPIIMSASSTAAVVSASPYAAPAFWERLWRTAGIQSVALFIIAYAIYGYQPNVGARGGEVLAFYGDGRTRVLIAAVLSGLAILNLLWFVAALRSV